MTTAIHAGLRITSSIPQTPGHTRRELFELRTKIHNAVTHMTSEQRTTFVLALVQRRTCAQVAQRLGVPYRDAIRAVEQVRDLLADAVRNGAHA